MNEPICDIEEDYDDYYDDYNDAVNAGICEICNYLQMDKSL